MGQFSEPKREPRWSQNGTNEGPKSISKMITKKKALQDRPGTVLRRSWVIPEAVWK